MLTNDEARPMNSLHMLAYLDPGSGAMILQMLIAGILTTGVVFRRALLYVPAMIFGSKPSQEAETPAETSAETR